jgi:hypothetical protein
MANKTAGPNATPLSNWKQWYVRSLENGENELSAKITFGGTGTVSAVSGLGVSCISYTTGGSGVYRVYIPACKDITPIVSYGGTTFANKIFVSAISAVSGYFDVAVHTAAGVSTPTSGDFFTFVAMARDSKVQV